MTSKSAMEATIPETVHRPLPAWLKAERAGSPAYFETARTLRTLNLHSVCEEARCPNIGECFAHHTATFMLMGDTCTRGCTYCAVGKGRPGPLDVSEPDHVAEAVMRLGLEHVVLTSVDRDDLPDGGAEHFVKTVCAIKNRLPHVRVEVLIPDFRGNRDSLMRVAMSPIAVLNHNTETIPRLYRDVRGGGKYEWTLSVLRWAKEARADLLTKSGLMLGLGETEDELYSVLRDLRAVGCDILTLGQYLRPTQEHRPVKRFVSPREFLDMKRKALALGFRHVESGPFVRSSYHAWEHVS